MNRSLPFYLLLSVLVLQLTACMSSVPTKTNNICEIFEEKRSWYKSAKRSFKKWGVPIQVQMAIIHQESHFDRNAKPARKKFLGIIPTFRPSSAFGFAQVKDETWDWYMSKTGNKGADRNDFDDATDFIGWYGNFSQSRLGISKWDTKNQYLAYHEGHGGYKSKSFNNKPWLIKVANQVDAKAKRYGGQLASCKKDLDRSFRLWPF